MSILSKIMYGLFALLLIGVTLLFFVPSLPVDEIDMKIVKSGSMEPSIMTGGIVVIRKSATYVPGDVITFQSQGADIPTTHRIISVEEGDGKTMFVTKGDANEDPDTEPVLRENVIGTVQFTVPFLGFVLDFARQPLGFAILIGLPSLLIIIDEAEKIWIEIRRKKNPASTRARIAPLVVAPFTPAPRVLMMDINRPAFSYTAREKREPIAPKVERQTHVTKQSWVVATSVVLVTSLLTVSIWSVQGTASYFNDTETTAQNELGAGILDFKANPDKSSFTFTNGTQSDQGDLITVLAPEAGSVPMKYRVTVEQTGGSVALCSAITASVQTPFSYNSTLLGLTADNVIFSGPLTLSVTLTPSSAYVTGDTCTVDIVYTGWNQSLNHSDGGYGDVERVPLTFTAPALPISGASAVNLGAEEKSADAPVIETLQVEPVSETIPPVIEETIPAPPEPETVSDPVPQA